MSTVEENRIKEIFEFLDLFGTKMGFYAERKPKFYTVLGGILSILSILISVVFFFLFSLDDLQRNSPIVTFSSISSAGYRKIKFKEEKIWIPIRIVDFYFNYVNHEQLVYPIIKHGFAKRSNLNEAFNIKFKKLNYKLCNETSMANKTDIYSINVSLHNL